MEEVLLCERELYDNYARLEPLQVFLNLTFDKVCIDYYSLRKYKICVKGSIHVRFLSTSFACRHRKVLHHNYKTYCAH